MAEQVSSRRATQARCARSFPRIHNRRGTDRERPQNFPDHQYPSIVGRPILRAEERDGDIKIKDIMCGDEAAAARSMLQITYPVRGPMGAVVGGRAV
jgi:hypothetical protein